MPTPARKSKRPKLPGRIQAAQTDQEKMILAFYGPADLPDRFEEFERLLSSVARCKRHRSVNYESAKVSLRQLEDIARKAGWQPNPSAEPERNSTPDGLRKQLLSFLGKPKPLDLRTIGAMKQQRDWFKDLAFERLVDHDAEFFEALAACLRFYRDRPRRKDNFYADRNLVWLLLLKHWAKRQGVRITVSLLREKNPSLRWKEYVEIRRLAERAGIDLRRGQ